MKKAIPMVIIFALITTILTSCVNPDVLRPFPYGKWESAELGLVLDVVPKINKEDAFPATFIEDGEKIDVYAFFLLTGGYLVILREPDWLSWGGARDTTGTIFDGNYRLRGERLYYTLTSFWQEQTGIKTVVFELIEDYEVAD